MDPVSESVLPPIDPEHIDASRQEDLQFITFFLGKETFAFPMSTVREIIRMPDLAEMPMAQESLAGLANLRGTILPIINLNGLLATPPSTLTDATRVVVVECGALVGFVVDRVDRVVSVDANKMEKVSSFNSSVDTGFLSGIVKEVAGHAMIMMLDVGRLIELNFKALTQIKKISKESASSLISPQDNTATTKIETDRRFVSFHLEGQEYAFSIEQVSEIVRVPKEISHIPKSANHVLGIINLRDRLLPLVSLRNMFGMPAESINEQSRVVVISIEDPEDPKKGQQSVGVLTDQVREVLRVPPDLLDTVPTVFSEDGQITQIHSICRLESGKRLVSILSVERMFEHDALLEALEMKRSQEENYMADFGQKSDSTDKEVQLVVFQLSNEEYGVAIESVQEIIRIPDELTHVPKAQHFIEGMVNLRGLLLPVVDLRSKLGMERMTRTERQRIVVFTLDGVRTGFIVDSVSEVLKLSSRLIEPAPDLSEDQQAFLTKVANLEKSKRMILILEVSHLLGDQEMNALKQTVH